MDIQRPSNARAKKIKRIVYVTVAVLACSGVTLAVSRLKPAAPSVDGSTVWPDTVKRGDMIRQVRGSTGTLQPREDSIQLIPALTDATVVHIRVLPGTMVKADTILMDLAAPEVEQKLLDAKLQVKAAEADFKDKQAQLQSTLMDKKILAAQVDASYAQDKLQADTDE